MDEGINAAQRKKEHRTMTRVTGPSWRPGTGGPAAFVALLLVVGGSAPVTAGTDGVREAAVARAVEHLRRVMDACHRASWAFRDEGSGCNRFPLRVAFGGGAAMHGEGGRTTFAGTSGLHAGWSPGGHEGGGFVFESGALLPGETAPRPAAGLVAGAGIDLRGARVLEFRARGVRGGERVEFFALGVGRHPRTGEPLAPHPDSAPKVTLCGPASLHPEPCPVTLSRSWRRYRIDLRGLDLSRVIGGFGWSVDGSWNLWRPVEFHLDGIVYRPHRRDEPRFLRSYAVRRPEGPDRVLANAAFLYDNALAILAFLAADEVARARLVADALVYARQHDRFWRDGRLRNAYAAGDLALPPGWWAGGRAGAVRLPGFTDETGVWREDGYQLGSDTGNLAWAILALVAVHEATGEKRYLAAALGLGEWIERELRDGRGAGGYLGGDHGFEPAPERQMWKSTEHNLDLLAAFGALGRVTGDRRWQERATHARRFVEAMFDEGRGVYALGTAADGVTVRTRPVVLDAQTLAVLALGPGPRTRRAVDHVRRRLRAHARGFSGFDFDDDRDMPWFEGTAQMALALRAIGRKAEADAWLAELVRVQRKAPTGGGHGIVAAPADGLTTGLGTRYPALPHVAATAWFVLAALDRNPLRPDTTDPGAGGRRVPPRRPQP